MGDFMDALKGLCPDYVLPTPFDLDDSGKQFVAIGTGTIWSGQTNLDGVVYSIYEAGKIGYPNYSVSYIRWQNNTISYYTDCSLFVGGDRFLQLSDLFDKADAVEQDKSNKQDEAAHALSNGDSVLQRIIRAALGFTNSFEPSTTEHDGITFYHVGRNASHEFYLGRKDGKTFKYCCGESGRTDDEGYDIPETNISECPNDSWGYVGHY